MKKHSFIGCRIRRCVVAALVLFSATLFSDCGSSESGPTRYEISGKVTYARQPVPHGEIAFEPDSVKGNSGPATIAVIENGYDSFDSLGESKPVGLLRLATRAGVTHASRIINTQAGVGIT